MSIASVTDRIQTIQAQIESLAGSSTTNAASAAAFGSELTAASGTSSLGRLSTATGTAADISDVQQRVISAAESALGKAYVWGGNSLSTGVDCSGLVQQAFKTVGIDLPRLSADQARSGTAVASLADARPGDLIAWDNSSRNNGADHIAIYLGDGKMIEAPRTGLNVRIVDVPSTPDYIRRVIDPTSVAGTGTSSRTTGASVTAALAALNGSDAVATSRSAYDLQALFSGGIR